MVKNTDYNMPIYRTQPSGLEVVGFRSKNGSTRWYLKDAFIYSQLVAPKIEMNLKRFYQTNGKLHREDGPAVSKGNGSREWWQHGKRHCETGPAIIGKRGTAVDYFINGTRLQPDDLKYKMLRRKYEGEKLKKKKDKDGASSRICAVS